ncbi:MAG: hypothetical protein FJX29_00685 [Alphaproteobacteria bacterium]|nr:hypothetical protein [Alphaproteobacteria bacterium]
MAYTLEAFCADTNAILKGAGTITERLDRVAGKLSLLMQEPGFAAGTFNEATPAGKRELWHDPELDYYVLAHVQEGGKRGTPHSHGASWAIYGNINGATRMREYARVNPEDEEGAVLKKIAEYDLCGGDTKAYGPGHIHSTEHPQKCWVIRITGTDLDQIPRYRFRKLRDRVLEEV